MLGSFPQRLTFTKIQDWHKFMEIKQWLLSIADYFRYKNSYSQDGEDVALAAFFENKKGYKGFFVDVGAHHPVRFSNTLAFYKKGWRGINIDPTPGSMRPFKRWRSRDINLEMGIGAQSGSMTFYCFNEPALNTFDKTVAEERDTGNPYKVIKKVSVPIAPLGEVMEKHLPAGQKIDFLSVDVEGLDFEVLKSNDWVKFAPAFVLVEDHQFQIDKPNSSEINVFLKGQGYMVAAALKRTIIYQRTPT